MVRSRFHNSIQATSQLMLIYDHEAASQEDLVHELFCMKRIEMTWSEVNSFLPDINENSIKRALTNLKNASKLVKTNNLVIGKYGKQTHKYRLA